MKWILLSACFWFQSSFAQLTALPVQAKSNRIIISCTDTGAALLNRLSDILLMRGYVLGEPSGKSLSTKDKNVPGYLIPMCISAFVKDSICYISGRVRMDKVLLGTDYNSFIVYTKHKSSFFYNAWSELVAIADSLKPLTIRYEILKD